MRARLSRSDPATLLFAAAVLISGATLLHFLSSITFWRDEWAFLLDRREWDLDVFLTPFVEQLLAIPILIYKTLLGLFGMDSHTPFQIPSTALFLLSVTLLYVYARRRVGGWLALALCLPLLFFGPSWDDLLFPFQVSFFGSTACGLGALLALDRDDRAGDIAATVLLALGLFFSHVGIPFVAAITIEIAARRDRFRRAYVIAIPTFLWLLWYLGWGHEATNFVSVHNFATLIGYVPDGFASSLSSYLGLAAPRDELTITPLDWGRPLLVLVVALALWRVFRAGPGSFPARLLTVVAIPTVFWSLTGLNASFFGEATSGRYQYLGAVAIVLIAAELLRGLRLPTLPTAVALAVSVVAALANFSTLENAADGLAGQALGQRAGLAALELARDEVDPDFEMTEENSTIDYLGIVTAEKYLAAVDEHGSPAFTPQELIESSEIARSTADRVSAAALRVGLAPAPGRPEGAGCDAPRDLTEEPAAVPARAGLVIRAESGSVDLRLRRFASESFPVALGSLEAGEQRTLVLPSDRASAPWELLLFGAGSALVCTPRAGA